MPQRPSPTYCPGTGSQKPEWAYAGCLLTDRRVPPTNNRSEQEIRPSVVFRKVTNGFRSQWGPAIHAGYRSVTGTARLYGTSAWNAIQALIGGTFALA
ncbi:IS66 family transposase [Niveispirillum cyanobacteriorum]|uniref:IS66 family transposase n=1 Tax=Niveispirillum cyanobacteriorum TaxID=1612173 RepID=UPI00248C72F5|nr:transposase [Niveispirillum cyanobacteriorum]